MSDFISSIPGKGGLDEGVPEPFALLPEMPDLEAASQQCSLVADEIEDIYPCTPFQEGLMAITARQKEAYIAQITLGIPDTIDVERLKHAWEHVMRLCPVLRTRIALNPLGRSMQVVTRCGIDWQIGVCLSSYLEGDLAQSMDYGRPLTRFAIINDENQGQTLVWTVHHALYDGWSIRLLFNHVERIYHGTNVLVPAPFSSFIGYQQDLMKSSDWKVFWHRQLVGGDYTPWPEVPSQTTVNANQTIHQYFDLQHTSRHGVAVSSLLRAAWAITLSLHASSERVIFAEILSGRDIPLAHATEVVGAMLSTVPMGVKIDFSLTVEEFLSQIQLQVADIMEYQHAGLQNIHRLLLAEEHQMPPLNNMFMIQPREASGDDTDSLELAAIPGYAMELGTFDTFPVNVQCTLQEEEAVDVQVAFDGEIVSLETMNHVLAVFVHLSRELAAASGKVPLGSLNTVPAADLALIQRYQKPPPSPVRACIHHIIENHVRQTPEATALHGYDGVLTYAQLWDASDSLAESLIHAGVNRGILVPLCFEKSVWAIVAMVAVLKAGGACVNLDSSNPFGRIETIVRDTEAKLIVTSPTQRSRLEALAPTLIAVDGEFLSTLYHRRSPAVERISSQPGDAAFLIYTSGSTGKPKAVINTHQALASSAAAHGAALDIGRQTRAIQFASYAFDSSIQDIATVLQRGGCICVISETDRTSNFAAAVRIFNGNYALLTTSVASLYTPDDLPSVRTLQLGGEPMRKSILQAWCGHARVMNTYGPAECSINVTCAADMQINDMESNIGVPVGCRCWVVQPDNADQLVPLGCIGELLVEGPILAKGYLHDPEKTRSVFISPPQWRRNLGIEKCERLYRTGDLVFQSKDGCFHYAGRKDAQVKLNGQRLEVEEIESLIQQHSTITQAAVVLPKAGPMSNRLVAIMVLCKSNPAPVNDLRIREVDTAVRTELVESILRMLTQSLPESIRVSYFLPVWDLPLTISRKMDRGKMRRWLESLSTDTFEAILSQDTTTRRAACGPRNPMEAAVLDACVRVLNLPVERIDMQRSFFGVGGDSIGAIQLASQLRAEGVKITVPEILQARSLAAVAEHAKEVEMHSGGAVDEPDNTLFGLSPIQQWYFSQQVPDTAEDDFIQYFNQSVYGTLASHVEEHDLRQAISALVEHHPMLRARFQLVDGIWQQAIRPTSSDAFTWRVHELAGVDEETLWVLAENSHTSLDLVNGSVFSVDMINFSDGRQSLLLIAHHLVVDIVSWTILLDDLEGLLQGKPILLQEQASFQSWCRRKFDSLRNSSAINKTEDSRDETNIEYWGSIPCGQRTNAYQKRKIACVDRETTSLVLGDANRPLHTEPVDLFLSAVCASFMNAFNDRHGLTVFIEGHGRDLRTTEFDLSRTVGWFTTVASLSLIDRSYNPNLASVAQTIKDLRKLSGSRSEDEFARRYMQLNPREREQPKEFLFNYHGMSTSIETNDTLFRQEYPRPFDIPDQGPDVPISALFEIGVAVVDGVSEFTVYWPEQLLYQDQIVAWIDSIPGCLRLLATRLMQCKTQYYSLSDFPLLNLDNARLARLQERVLPRVRQLCRAPIQDVLPCSSMQDGILLAQAKQEKNYQTVQEFEICPSASGQSVDLHRLAEAWKQVVLRHPSLRTVFVESVDNSSAFSQVVLEAFEPDIVCVEAPHRLKGLSTVNYSELRPPHRLALAPADSGTVACSLELSHAIMDAASASIIVRDWTQAYEGAGPQPGRDCQLTYVEFIKQIRAIPHQKKLKYWTTYLANVEPCHFPPGPVARSSSPQCHTAVCEVNRFETARIRQFCAEIEVSPATLFQAAWALVLSQYVGTRDVCFGYLASGRDGPVTGIKDAVGAFINMLICRVQFSTSQMTASQFIQNLQQHSLEHLKFQHCTLAEIHHALGIPHGRALFNTIMSIQGNDKDASLDEQSNSLKFVEISGRDPHEVCYCPIASRAKSLFYFRITDH